MEIRVKVRTRCECRNSGAMVFPSDSVMLEIKNTCKYFLTALMRSNGRPEKYIVAFFISAESYLC